MTPFRGHRAATQGLVVLALTVGLCAGCGDDPEETDPDAGSDGEGSSSLECDAAPIELEGTAAIFDLTDVAEPIASTTEDGYVIIDARSDHPLEELVIEFVDVVGEAGFDQAGSEDEGFEGEVFFSSGDVAAGQVKLTESDCDGLVDVRISVLDDPAVLPTG